MKRTALSIAALVAFCGGALAADLPARTFAPEPFAAPLPPVFTWTGFYAGVNAGVGFNVRGDRQRSFQTQPFGPNGQFQGTVTYGDNIDDAAFVGGGQIGYNFQFGQWVIGAEADIQALRLRERDGRNATLTGAFPGAGEGTFQPAFRGTTGIDWFGTVRLRGGVAFDRFLVYATGGAAYARGPATRTEFPGDNGFFRERNIEWGWTVGAGVDYAWTDNLIVGLEGLYVNIDRGTRTTGFAGTFTDAAGNVQPVGTVGDRRRNDDIEFGLVRLRLNYKF